MPPTIVRIVDTVYNLDDIRKVDLLDQDADGQRCVTLTYRNGEGGRLYGLAARQMHTIICTYPGAIFFDVNDMSLDRGLESLYPGGAA